MSQDIPPEKIDAAVTKRQQREKRKDTLWGIAWYAMISVFALFAILCVAEFVVKGVRNLRYILDMLSSIASLVIAIYLIMFLRDVVKRVFKKNPIKWEDYHPRTWFNTKLGALLVFVVIVGVVNLIAARVFQSTEIGAFYEQKRYDETYEAVLTIGENPIFCLAEISRADNEYTIWEVHLPYGKSCYTDCEYEPSELKEQIDINGYDCFIELIRPATDQSYALLENSFVSNYGEFCASKESDVFHFLDCPAVNSIKPSNLVYFRDEREARILGFGTCRKCSYNF